MNSDVMLSREGRDYSELGCLFARCVTNRNPEAITIRVGDYVTWAMYPFGGTIQKGRTGYVSAVPSGPSMASARRSLGRRVSLKLSQDLMKKENHRLYPFTEAPKWS